MGFGSNYVGDPTATETPSAAPGPGVSPTVYLPADQDGNTSANWYQALRVLADFIAYFFLYFFPSKPTTLSTLPQWRFHDAALNARFLVDHNGFPTGRLNLMREEWLFVQASTSTPANPLSSYPLWKTTISGTSAAFGGAGAFGVSLYGGRTANLQPLNAATGAKSFIATTNQLIDPSKTRVTWSLEWDAAPDAVGANGTTIYIGMSSAQDPSAAASGFAWFKKASTDTNWQCQCGQGAPGGTVTNTDSGVVPVPESSGNGLQRFKIELHGSATVYGAQRVMFYIDDALVATITTNIPTVTQYLAFGGITTATSGTMHDISIGTITLDNNRFVAALG